MQGWSGSGHIGVRWLILGWDGSYRGGMGHLGWVGSCRVQWIIHEWGELGHTWVGWVMQGWGGL